MAITTCKGIYGEALMQKKLSVLHANPHSDARVCFDASLQRGVEFIDFPISYAAEPESDLHLAYSLASTPARYVEMLIVRALAVGVKGSLLVLNPKVQFYSELYNSVIAFAGGIHAGAVAVISSYNDCPLAYFFGAEVVPSESMLFRLRFLSSVSALLDREYLSVALQRDVQLSVQKISVSDCADGWILSQGFQSLYPLVTFHALAAFRSLPQGLPRYRIAVMPYHAGDVLFFMKAFCRAEHPFNALIVHEEFAPIVKKIAPDLELILVKENSVGRGAYADSALTSHKNDEILFFHHVIYKYIPPGALFYWFRMSKDYAFANSHMIDQWINSLSNDRLGSTAGELRCLSHAPSNDKSVLLHFDGGWLLKIYPQEQQRVLVDLLRAQGYRVSVLTSKALAYSVHTVPFRSVAALEADILSHAIFVGMDSFPVHFATHVLLHPSICLFSSTRPANSNASVFSGYRYMNKGLPCSPCTMHENCDTFSNNFCKNFSSPEDVLVAVDTMFQAYYEGKSI